MQLTCVRQVPSTLQRLGVAVLVYPDHRKAWHLQGLLTPCQFRLPDRLLGHPCLQLSFS